MVLYKETESYPHAPIIIHICSFATTKWVNIPYSFLGNFLHNSICLLIIVTTKVEATAIFSETFCRWTSNYKPHHCSKNRSILPGRVLPFKVKTPILTNNNDLLLKQRGSTVSDYQLTLFSFGKIRMCDSLNDHVKTVVNVLHFTPTCNSSGWWWRTFVNFRMCSG